MEKTCKRRTAIAILAGSTFDVFADEKSGLGKRILSGSEKIARSFNSAQLILIGKFVSTGSKPTPVDHEIGLLACSFEVSRRLDGGEALDSSRISMTIPTYMPLAGDRGDKTAAVDLNGLREAERALNGTAVSESEYLKSIRSARMKVVSSKQYLERFFVTNIRAGSLDSSYRVADVAVEFGREYVLFLTRRPISGHSFVLFPNEFDIYDAEDSEFKNVALPRR